MLLSIQMPMEVYTISGADDDFGYIPANLKKIDMEQQAAVAGNAPPAVQLQNALKALGNVTGDPVLKALVVDGKLGPKTVAAVNRALAKYVGATKYFPRADLQLVHVRNHTVGITGLIVDRVKKSGGTVPVPVIERSSVVKRTAASVFTPASEPVPNDNKKLILYVVGGVSLLMLLAITASVVKRKKTA